MRIRSLLRNFGIKNVSIYQSKDGILQIFYLSKFSIDNDVANCIKMPIYINGIKYNIPP